MANRSAPLGEFEQIVLLAVRRLGEGAYAVPIRREISTRTGRSPARGALYITLDRLERKGYLESRLSDPGVERGNRARRYYHVTAEGVRALEHSWAALRRMWEGLEPRERET